MSERRHIPSLSHRLRPAVWSVLILILFPPWCPAETASNVPPPSANEASAQKDFEFTQAQLLEETLGAPHDELIMLIISLAVVIQIAFNFRFLQWIQHKALLFGSFGFLLLSAVCTVAENLFLTEVLNYVEHLCFMASSILLAFWCGSVFVAKSKEGG